MLKPSSRSEPPARAHMEQDTISGCVSRPGGTAGWNFHTSLLSKVVVSPRGRYPCKPPCLDPSLGFLHVVKRGDKASDSVSKHIFLGCTGAFVLHHCQPCDRYSSPAQRLRTHWPGLWRRTRVARGPGYRLMSLAQFQMVGVPSLASSSSSVSRWRVRRREMLHL